MREHRGGVVDPPHPESQRWLPVEVQRRTRPPGALGDRLGHRGDTVVDAPHAVDQLVGCRQHPVDAAIVRKRRPDRLVARDHRRQSPPQRSHVEPPRHQKHLDVEVIVVRPGADEVEHLPLLDTELAVRRPVTGRCLPPANPDRPNLADMLCRSVRQDLRCMRRRLPASRPGWTTPLTSLLTRPARQPTTDHHERHRHCAGRQGVQLHRHLRRRDHVQLGSTIQRRHGFLRSLALDLPRNLARPIDGGFTHPGNQYLRLFRQHHECFPVQLQPPADTDGLLVEAERAGTCKCSKATSDRSRLPRAYGVRPMAIKPAHTAIEHGRL